MMSKEGAGALGVIIFIVVLVIIVACSLYARILEAQGKVDQQRLDECTDLCNLRNLSLTAAGYYSCTCLEPSCIVDGFYIDRENCTIQFKRL
jgi:hypothetical protein